MARVFGYLRVSTKGQTTENQKKEILDKGFAVNEWISEEAVSGTVEAFERPQFKRMIEMSQAGDIIITVKIDRLGRTAADTLQVIKTLKEMELSVVIIQFGTTDMTSSAGKMMLTVLAAVAEMERDMLIERIHSGLERTKAQGTKLGPPLKIEPVVMQQMVEDRKNGFKLKDIAKKHNLILSTVDRNLKAWGEKVEEYKQEWNSRQVQYSR